MDTTHGSAGIGVGELSGIWLDDIAHGETHMEANGAVEADVIRPRNRVSDTRLDTMYTNPDANARTNQDFDPGRSKPQDSVGSHGATDRNQGVNLEKFRPGTATRER